MNVTYTECMRFSLCYYALLLQTIKYSDLTIVDVIGEGGFAIVHLAKHPQWKTVAYKELKITTTSEKYRFVYYYAVH